MMSDPRSIHTDDETARHGWSRTQNTQKSRNNKIYSAFYRMDLRSKILLLFYFSIHFTFEMRFCVIE